jgi:hypothetical protein
VEEFNPFTLQVGAGFLVEQCRIRVLGTSVTSPKVGDGIQPFHVSINMEPAAQPSSPSISPIAIASPFKNTSFSSIQCQGGIFHGLTVRSDKTYPSRILLGTEAARTNMPSSAIQPRTSLGQAQVLHRSSEHGFEGSNALADRPANARQCICSPTTHPWSFKRRLQRRWRGKVGLMPAVRGRRRHAGLQQHDKRHFAAAVPASQHHPRQQHIKGERRVPGRPDAASVRTSAPAATSLLLFLVNKSLDRLPCQ